MKNGFQPWEVTEQLRTEDDIQRYWQACLAEGEEDPEFLIQVLHDIARARNMNQLAKEAGITRSGLYKALSGDSNPDFATILNIIHALGLRLAPAMPETEQDLP